LKTSAKSFYEKLVRPLNADVFVMFQAEQDGFDELNENIVKIKNYKKPDSNSYFNFKTMIGLKGDHDNNWKKESNLQQYINFNLISESWGDTLANEYDMVIMVRSDFLHLFDFPDILSHYPSNDRFWSYEGHEWGGINYTLMAVPSRNIIEYLTSPYNIIINYESNLKIIQEPMNCERFMKAIFYHKGWIINKIKVNSFLTADDEKTTTTWATIKKSEKYNVIYKYEEQLESAYKNFENWENGKKWKLKDEIIMLD
jgi:hypothetical protein